MANFTIHHPLLVFDTVHRRTGSLERACIFINQLAEPLSLKVDFDFPEHSWVQIYGPEDGGNENVFIDGQSLSLQPGENTVLISFNTDNFNFPDKKFKGRIAFQGEGDDGSREWIEILFENVQDLAPFPGYAAIDLGTSSSTVSLYHIQRDAVRRMPWNPKLDGADANIPSVLFIRNFRKFMRGAEGGCLVGRQALEAYRSADPKDPRCLQLNAKRVLGLPQVLIADEKGNGGFADPRNLLQALLKFVREQSQNHAEVRSLIKRVSVTYPPAWSYQEIIRLREVFLRLGFREEALDFSLDEASAAGLFYLYTWVRERDSRNRLIQDLLDSEENLNENGRQGKRYTLHLLSFDFGGGSIDLALIEAKMDLFPQAIRLSLALLGSDSCDFGGDQVTLALFRILKRRLAMSICEPARMRKERAGTKEEPAARSPEPSWLPPRLGADRRSGYGTFLLPDSPSRGWNPALDFRDGSEALEPSRRMVLENWGYLNARISSKSVGEELEGAIDQLFPTRFLPSGDEIYRLEARRNFDWLWNQAEGLKRRLFDEVERLHGKDIFPDFECLREITAGLALRDAPNPKIGESIPWAGDPVSERVLSASAAEVFQAISEPLEAAFDKAQRLVGGKKIDRVVFSGQSSRMPMVRWMFSRPHNEGGFSIPPAKIEFDAENAKAAVSKGACLLQVLRETVVGFEVDVADFKAHLPADIYYLGVEGDRKVLFDSGPIDDFAYVEIVPEFSALPKYFSVFYGSEHHLLGQFLFGEEGEELPAVSFKAPKGAPDTPPGSVPPAHPELLKLRAGDRTKYAGWVAALLKWPDEKRIAWMEATAPASSSSQGIYRFYLTRNHQLYAVRDAGKNAKRLYRLKNCEAAASSAWDPSADPFSGAQ